MKKILKENLIIAQNKHLHCFKYCRYLEKSMNWSINGLIDRWINLWIDLCVPGLEHGFFHHRPGILNNYWKMIN